VTGDYRTTRDGITVEIQRDWIARPPERDIAPTGLGMCEFCEFDVLAGSEIASVNDGRYAHYDCVPWGVEEDEEDEEDELRKVQLKPVDESEDTWDQP
jgi:hypothetical protein